MILKYELTEEQVNNTLLLLNQSLIPGSLAMKKLEIEQVLKNPANRQELLQQQVVQLQQQLTDTP
jgi:hypothetical protein